MACQTSGASSGPERFEQVTSPSRSSKAPQTGMRGIAAGVPDQEVACWPPRLHPAHRVTKTANMQTAASLSAGSVGMAYALPNAGPTNSRSALLSVVDRTTAPRSTDARCSSLTPRMLASSHWVRLLAKASTLRTLPVSRTPAPGQTNHNPKHRTLLSSGRARRYQVVGAALTRPNGTAGRNRQTSERHVDFEVMQG